jgi:hypothetical protein
MIVVGFSLFLGVLVLMWLLNTSPEDKGLIVNEITIKTAVL